MAKHMLWLSSILENDIDQVDHIVQLIMSDVLAHAC